MTEKNITEILGGKSFELYRHLGAHSSGDFTRFCYYEPNCTAVKIILPDRTLSCQPNGNGFFSLTADRIPDKTPYLLEVTTGNSDIIRKTDPFARKSLPFPKSGSEIYESDFSRTDGEIPPKSFDIPLNIYELHVGSWRKNCTFARLERELVPYIKKMGYTHIQLMPVTCHPNSGSWGYQSSGFFAVQPSFGTPDELKSLVNACHKQGIGVIFDLSLAHFAADPWALDNPKNIVFGGDFSHWGSPMFNFESGYVRSFLNSVSAYFLEEFHGDGLRIDAVSEISRTESGKRFLNHLNDGLHERFPNALITAEDSTPGNLTTLPTEKGGLGFDYKQSLGWMNDTLAYFTQPPWYRAMKAESFTRPEKYFADNRYILPLSHDEVVHCKGSLMQKMSVFGDEKQQLSALKMLYLYMYVFPGKKLSFMGNELALSEEWNENRGLEEYCQNADFADFTADLNRFYRETPCLWQNENTSTSFRWLEADGIRSVFAGQRSDGKASLYILLNFSSEAKKITFYPEKTPSKSPIFSTAEENITLSQSGNGGYSAILPTLSAAVF
ncbi:MAG: hypothetical protein J5999_00050 [Oscillospiraceae bacterium]|nr:hypothetical protein [Oscillospiraceae bacterium]